MQAVLGWGRHRTLLWTTAGSLLLVVTLGTCWSLSTDRRIGSSSRSRRPSSLQAYFQRHGTLPLPDVPHVVLTNMQYKDGHGVLVIGDVHGCYEEMMQLHDKAVRANDGRPLALVVLVGDLGNKGPFSAKVVRHCRKTPRWIAVRGNHDNAALLAACGDARRKDKPKYSWVQELNQKDIDWMSQLPYTILLPKGLQGLSRDHLVVHAGLEPGLPLTEQTVETMTKVRDVEHQPWAVSHQGPSHVVFGHDAKRGLKLYNHATGLDTGCVYGKKLTGLLLPQNQLLSVPAKAEYEAIVAKPEN